MDGLCTLKVHKPSTQAMKARVKPNSQKKGRPRKNPTKPIRTARGRPTPHPFPSTRTPHASFKSTPMQRQHNPAPAPTNTVNVRTRHDHYYWPIVFNHIRLSTIQKTAKRKLIPPGLTGKATTKNHLHKLSSSETATRAPPAQEPQLQLRRGPRQ